MVETILLDFDLSICAVAYHMGEFKMSEETYLDIYHRRMRVQDTWQPRALKDYDISHGANCLDERRIKKYQKRGYRFMAF